MFGSGLNEPGLKYTPILPVLSWVRLLVLVDAHSKWLEVLETTATTSACTIQKLQLMFSTHGLPEMLVTDNGPAFVSEVFQAFLRRNGVRHIRSSPYHPASNGLAERAVGSTTSYSLGSVPYPISTRYTVCTPNECTMMTRHSHLHAALHYFRSLADV